MDRHWSFENINYLKYNLWCKVREIQRFKVSRAELRWLVYTCDMCDLWPSVNPGVMLSLFLNNLQVIFCTFFFCFELGNNFRLELHVLVAWHRSEPVHIGSNLCEATKIWGFCRKLFPRPTCKKNMQTNSWRWFKHYGILRFGLMCRQKSHLAHEYAGHRSRERACLNSCISLENIWIAIWKHKRLHLSIAYPWVYPK